MRSKERLIKVRGSYEARRPGNKREEEKFFSRFLLVYKIAPLKELERSGK